MNWRLLPLYCVGGRRAQPGEERRAGSQAATPRARTGAGRGTGARTMPRRFMMDGMVFKEVAVWMLKLKLKRRE